MNSTNTVISAQDYDVWGYPLENRSYQSENSKYKFTGKERDRDIESNYDYFPACRSGSAGRGARYYDSRIGRWGQVKPLLDKYLSFSPYIYIFDNPTNIVDVDGRGPGGDDIQPSETQILESGTDIMGAGITILITVKVFDAIFGRSNDEIKETQSILENEQVVITDDKAITKPNIYSERGKTRKKETDYSNESTEKLLEKKKELSNKKRSKEDKAEIRKIDRELKARKYKHSRQKKDFKQENKWDPNN